MSKISKARKKLEQNQLEMIYDQMSKDENELQKEERFAIKKSPYIKSKKNKNILISNFHGKTKSGFNHIRFRLRSVGCI